MIRRIERRDSRRTTTGASSPTASLGTQLTQTLRITKTTPALLTGIYSGSAKWNIKAATSMDKAGRALEAALVPSLVKGASRQFPPKGSSRLVSREGTRVSFSEGLLALQDQMHHARMQLQLFDGVMVRHPESQETVTPVPAKVQRAETRRASTSVPWGYGSEDDLPMPVLEGGTKKLQKVLGTKILKTKDRVANDEERLPELRMVSYASCPIIDCKQLAFKAKSRDYYLPHQLPKDIPLHARPPKPTPSQSRASHRPDITCMQPKARAQRIRMQQDILFQRLWDARLRKRAQRRQERLYRLAQFWRRHQEVVGGDRGIGLRALYGQEIRHLEATGDHLLPMNVLRERLLGPGRARRSVSGEDLGPQLFHEPDKDFLVASVHGIFLEEIMRRHTAFLRRFSGLLSLAVRSWRRGSDTRVARKFECSWLTWMVAILAMQTLEGTYQRRFRESCVGAVLFVLSLRRDRLWHAFYHGSKRMHRTVALLQRELRFCSVMRACRIDQMRHTWMRVEAAMVDYERKRAWAAIRKKEKEREDRQRAPTLDHHEPHGGEGNGKGGPARIHTIHAGTEHEKMHASVAMKIDALHAPLPPKARESALQAAYIRRKREYMGQMREHNSEMQRYREIADAFVAATPTVRDRRESDELREKTFKSLSIERPKPPTKTW
ncbi:unnamed protein product [Vitrella brassicaformis CCMP3155]|uniref:Uncharacterized protein n=3 Tax=Vitrella brassicaformis TaxID=1169539 RepID=A0A0G4F6F1_VITBC|nr:unnamed protein product [Vitrella brassicaformis CCMP3155]|eukprot:CEM07988.1 unnamed protein product [Vitrella brassicaformis CCMP3155]